MATAGGVFLSTRFQVHLVEPRRDSVNGIGSAGLRRRIRRSAAAREISNYATALVEGVHHGDGNGVGRHQPGSHPCQRASVSNRPTTKSDPKMTLLYRASQAGK